MRFTKTLLLPLVYSIGCGCFLAACVPTTRVIQIPTVLESAKPSLNRNSDYPEILAAILSIMVRELKLPAVDGTVTFYPNGIAMETALVTEFEKEFEQAEKQLSPKAKEIFRERKQENIALAARQRATTAVAVGMHKRILVNDLVFGKYAWSERVRVVAHELTHTVEKALADGRLVNPDLWLVEGLADWVAYKVLEALDIEVFSKSRERSVDGVVNARYYQTFPALTQLGTGKEWNTWVWTLGRAATYGQAFLAVDFLINEKGFPALVEYFRLFAKLNNRERNFATAFGEPVAEFSDRFGRHLQVLLGK